MPKLPHALAIGAAVALAAITTYLSSGGPQLIIGGISVLSVAATVLGTYLQSPLAGATK